MATRQTWHRRASTLKTERGTVTLKVQGWPADWVPVVEDLAVDAEIVGGLALHHTAVVAGLVSEPSDPWNITHVASGLSVAQFIEGERFARVLLLRLLDVADWTRPSDELGKAELTEEQRSAIALLMLDPYTDEVA